MKFIPHLDSVFPRLTNLATKASDGSLSTDDARGIDTKGVVVRPVTFWNPAPRGACPLAPLQARVVALVSCTKVPLAGLEVVLILRTAQ